MTWGQIMLDPTTAPHNVFLSPTSSRTVCCMLPPSLPVTARVVPVDFATRHHSTTALRPSYLMLSGVYLVAAVAATLKAERPMWGLACMRHAGWAQLRALVLQCKNSRNQITMREKE